MARFAVLLLSLLLCAAPVSARDHSAFKEISVAALPKEARQTLALIQAGGPFPYRQDGVVFGNREKLLPLQRRGYYREYTVKTPGSRRRGARRIVAGSGARGDVSTSNEYWYTADHYQSFRRIVNAKGK